MVEQVQKMFSSLPSVMLVWRGHSGKLGSYYYADRLVDAPLLRQFMAEAGLKRNGAKISIDQYDAVLVAASKHGYGITAIGGPDDD